MSAKQAERTVAWCQRPTMQMRCDRTRGFRRECLLGCFLFMVVSVPFSKCWSKKKPLQLVGNVIRVKASRLLDGKGPRGSCAEESSRPTRGKRFQCTPGQDVPTH